MIKKIQKLIENAETIVIIQADNPDGDSLSSSLALEHILGDQGKKVHLYCGVDIPTYLRYLQGWDRVSNQLPTKFDLSIVVDTSSLKLLETLEKSKQLSWVAAKPCLVIDHHQIDNTIDFATERYSPKAVSTTEVIHNIATSLSWPINKEAGELIVSGILSDSLGLTTQDVSPASIHVIADMVENGADLAKLDNERKLLQKKSKEILKYKGELLQKVEYDNSGQVAFVTIPWAEIEKYSHAYNPSVLVIDEMRQVEGVKIAAAFKLYPDGRITCKIRANYGNPIASQLAEYFDGGGHKYASGFRITDKRSYDQVKNEFLDKAIELLAKEVAQ